MRNSLMKRISFLRQHYLFQVHGYFSANRNGIGTPTNGAKVYKN